MKADPFQKDLELHSEMDLKYAQAVLEPEGGVGDEEEFVDPERFCELLCSNRKLVRADDGARNLRGLFDRVLKKYFYVEESALHAYWDR